MYLLGSHFWRNRETEERAGTGCLLTPGTGGGRGILLIWGFYRLAFLYGDREGVGWRLGEIILMYLRRLKEDPERIKWVGSTYLYRGQVTEELIVKKYVNTTSFLGRYQKLCIQYFSGKVAELYKKRNFDALTYLIGLCHM
jgi:hypothetical protein